MSSELCVCVRVRSHLGSSGLLCPASSASSEPLLRERPVTIPASRTWTGGPLPRSRSRSNQAPAPPPRSHTENHLSSLPWPRRCLNFLCSVLSSFFPGRALPPFHCRLLCMVDVGCVSRSVVCSALLCSVSCVPRSLSPCGNRPAGRRMRRTARRSPAARRTPGPPSPLTESARPKDMSRWKEVFGAVRWFFIAFEMPGIEAAGMSGIQIMLRKPTLGAAIECRTRPASERSTPFRTIGVRGKAQRGNGKCAV